MRLKKFMSVLAFAVFCKSAFAVTTAYWVGGESGDWETASNWSCNSAPYTANYLVFVTNETPVTITLSKLQDGLPYLFFRGESYNQRQCN